MVFAAMALLLAKAECQDKGSFVTRDIMTLTLPAGTSVSCNQGTEPEAGARAPELPTSSYENCSIVARHMYRYDDINNSGIIEKDYGCAGGVEVRLFGQWSDVGGSDGGIIRHEFGTYFLGQTGDFNIRHRRTLPLPVDEFHNCISDSISGRANYAGYMSEEETYTCDCHKVALRGKWGDEFQGHWSYHLSLGEVDSKPQWVDDVEEIIHFSRSYQKYCPTKYGYRLCGWVDTPVVDHGNPPQYKR